MGNGGTTATRHATKLQKLKLHAIIQTILYSKWRFCCLFFYWTKLQITNWRHKIQQGSLAVTLLCKKSNCKNQGKNISQWWLLIKMWNTSALDIALQVTNWSLACSSLSWKPVMDKGQVCADDFHSNIHTYIHTCIHTYIYAYMHIYIYIYI